MNSRKHRQLLKELRLSNVFFWKRLHADVFHTVSSPPVALSSSPPHVSNDWGWELPKEPSAVLVWEDGEEIDYDTFVLSQASSFP